MKYQLTPTANSKYFKLVITELKEVNFAKLIHVKPDSKITTQLGYVTKEHTPHFIHHMQEAFVYLED